MALADHTRRTTADALARLDALHDYFNFTQRVWKLADEVVADGPVFNVRNPATKRRLNQGQLVAPADPHLDDYLIPMTFQSFVSRFEDFFFDLLRAWLAAYPASPSAETIALNSPGAPAARSCR